MSVSHLTRASHLRNAQRCNCVIAGQYVCDAVVYTPPPEGGSPGPEPLPSITAQESTQVVVEGTEESQVTIADKIYNRVVTTRRYVKTITASVEGVTFTAGHPEFATVDSNGVTTVTGTGTATVTLSKDGYLPTGISWLTKTSQTVDTFSEFVEGTLAAHMEEQVASRVSGKVPATDKRVFTSQDYSTPNYTRNAGCWAADLVSGLTAFSPYNTRSAGSRAGTAITPRHFVLATHFPVEVGDTLWFITEAGVVVARTVLSLVSSNDLTLGCLSADLPETVSPLKVMPQAFFDKIALRTFIPVATVDAEEKLGVALFTQEVVNFNGSRSLQWSEPTGDLAPWYEQAIGGDSGNPICGVVNDELVLMALYGGPTNGASLCGIFELLSDLITQADAAAGVTTGYLPTEVDLSSFPDL